MNLKYYRFDDNEDLFRLVSDELKNENGVGLEFPELTGYIKTQDWIDIVGEDIESLPDFPTLYQGVLSYTSVGGERIMVFNIDVLENFPFAELAREIRKTHQDRLVEGRESSSSHTR